MIMAVRHRMMTLRSLPRLVLVGLQCLLSGQLLADPGAAMAFYYGKESPAPLCQRYRHVIIEADHLAQAGLPDGCAGVLYAYVSVGEAERWRAGYEKLDKTWFLGENHHWGSDIVDLTRREWQDHILYQRIAVVWRRGIRGVFLDTLDSFELVIDRGEQRRAQLQALVDLIERIDGEFPGIKILLNRGFDVLPQVHRKVAGIAAESLFRGWNPSSNRYIEVDQKSRRWLITRLRKVQSAYGLPVTVIDYVPESDPGLAQSTARKIRKLGFYAWVSVANLDRFGTGGFGQSQ